MDTDALRRLHYAAAVACGMFAALVAHILLMVFGIGLDAVLRDASTGNKQQFISAIAWWAIGGAGFVGGWAAAAYLIAAARERELIYRLAQRFLIALVLLIVLIAAGLLFIGGVLGDADGRRGILIGALAVLVDEYGRKSSSPVGEVHQIETRSHTKIRVSPGAITCPAPRSP